MSPAESVLNQALELSAEERAEIARQLLLSLEPDDLDPDYEAAWAGEIERRLAAVENGNYTASDWQESLGRIRDRLREGRSA